MTNLIPIPTIDGETSFVNPNYVALVSPVQRQWAEIAWNLSERSAGDDAFEMVASISIANAGKQITIYADMTCEEAARLLNDRVANPSAPASAADHFPSQA